MGILANALLPNPAKLRQVSKVVSKKFNRP